jgi:anti-sigma factor RsiW
MTYDPFTDRLSDYIDAPVSSADRDEIEAHLTECDDCNSIVTELRAIRRDASMLAPVDPPEHVWTSLSSRLRAGGAPRSHNSSMYTALAAAAALVLGISLWIAIAPTDPPTDANDPQALVDMVTEELRAAESHYENAIVGLEQIIAQNEGSLPPDLNQTINENLDLIEQTIDESRNALVTNPDSPVAQESLLEAFRRKVSLLRNTILLINEVRKGEGENALDLIDEIRETDDPSNPI